MDQSKYNQMQKMLHKLEDIKNSQESIIDKIILVIADLFLEPDKELENALKSAHERASKNVDIINNAMEDYAIRFNKAR